MNAASRGPLTEPLVQKIAAALGASCEPAPFRVADSTVYRLGLTPPSKPALQLTLWPALARADVLAGDYYAVFKGITNVLLYPGLEVIFQRGERQGFLLVSRDGRVATAS